MNHASNSPNEDKIMDFWRWFVKNEGTIQRCIENESQADRDYVVEQMNSLVLNIGTFTWDVGLNDSNNWFLTISPNGDKDLLKLSTEIMAFAPDHMNWEFHASKPAKNWDRKFSVYNDNFDLQDIDAASWHYAVFQEEDGTLELILEAKNIGHLDKETAETAAHQFLTHELGEQLKIERISSVSILHEIELEYQTSKSPISEIKEHLQED
jgi:hypothetical protein